ncbi:hypothetical protein ARMGADRAFT_105054 [Armillaria gallica]|uniref:Uncharacterized protein n=1 Tax=Armillaria gallica TaxID=47427 RepID=A0A2H3CKL8_ARMGA|nr:hypothetical protein ARMGADRAFT_105054 [Armillaria gallica]
MIWALMIHRRVSYTYRPAGDFPDTPSVDQGQYGTLEYATRYVSAQLCFSSDGTDHWRIADLVNSISRRERYRCSTPSEMNSPVPLSLAYQNTYPYSRDDSLLRLKLLLHLRNYPRCEEAAMVDKGESKLWEDDSEAGVASTRET